MAFVSFTSENLQYKSHENISYHNIELALTELDHFSMVFILFWISFCVLCLIIEGKIEKRLIWGKCTLDTALLFKTVKNIVVRQYLKCLNLLPRSYKILQEL